ncbi:sensor histidine kinase [Ammoniphilus resinae]|uniref:Oxygen sensor histidine kinase NreB n=1 Tax=Ammoniphilus resinae TaxID=861532 RepID=A0ABS4GQZ2_9BACL|nr:ATP-binding protein [Ammoniphilus resinae]MBP1932696.1 two-component system sensor histidine kinase NreB [Ammoniphilus resinae]
MGHLATQRKITSYIIQSQEEEIKRLSTELHEGIAQTLYSLLTGLEIIQNGLESHDMKQYVEQLKQLSKRTIEEVRWISTELHPAVLDTHGILPALQSYNTIYTSTFGIEVDLEVSGEPIRLLPSVEILLYRICQEILSNAAKYADTNRVRITFHWSKKELKVHIEDFGVGFCADNYPDQELALGIAAMREKVALAGGEFEISSALGKGTTVTLHFPLEPYVKGDTDDSFANCG